MNIEEDILEIAMQYIIGLEDTNYRVQAVIHINDIPNLIKEILETFEVKPLTS